MFDINFIIIGLVLMSSLYLVMKYNAKQAALYRIKQQQKVF